MQSLHSELIHPTPYADVNAVLSILLSDITTTLGDQFVGMYLYGSLASGDFDQDSDVDYVVVTDDALSSDLFANLQAMHTRIAMLDFWCATQLEGSYVPQHALRQYDPVHALHLHIDRGRGERLNMMRLDNAMISRAWWGGWVILRESLRERGITLAGPAPQSLIDPVSSNDLRQAAWAILHGWAARILDDPAQMSTRGYQSYTVLTVCRILYTLQSGHVVSKPVAARWAQQTLGERWTALIERAWVGRRNPQMQAPSDDLNGTLDLIHFALERSQQFEIATDEGRTS